MDRQIVWPGAIPLETDLLNTNRSAMLALGFLAQDILGSGTLVSGFSCTPTTPGSLAVNIAPGRIYALENVDGTAYSSLAADTAHSVVKQGIALDATQLALAAPSTSGMSVNYLIEAAFSEVDADAVALPYYNAANPAQPYLGPNNSGSAQYTQRKGGVVLTAKAGVAATTGSQTTPSPDSGNVGLWVVTVANGQSAITSGNIAQYNAGAAWIQNTLNLLAPLASPALTGYPTAPTPASGDSSTKLATTNFVTNALLYATTQAQFDNSVKVATTAFVQRALGSKSGLKGVGANYTIVPGDVGKAILAGTIGITLTLPLASSVPAGAIISTYANIPSGSVSFAVQGSDKISVGGSSGQLISSATMLYGESCDWATDGTTWYAIGRSAFLGYTGSFAASINTNGYQKLPSGRIEVQGTFTASATAGAAVPVTFPLSGTNCRNIVLTPVSTGTTAISAWFDTPTGTGFNGHCSVAGATVHYRAILD